MYFIELLNVYRNILPMKVSLSWWPFDAILVFLGFELH